MLVDNNDKSYQAVLEHLGRDPHRDAHSSRVAAVTRALVEVAAGGAGGSDVSTVAARTIYSHALTALEGTLQQQQNDVAESLATQVALLHLMHVTIPYVMPVYAVDSELVLTSRVLRAIVSSCRNVNDAAIADGNAAAGGGGGSINGVLRGCCHVTTELLARVHHHKNDGVVQQLYRQTLMVLWIDRRPKVRKVAQQTMTDLLARDGVHPIIGPTTSKALQSTLQAAVKEAQGGKLSVNLHLFQILEGVVLHLKDMIDIGGMVMELFMAIVQMTDSRSSTASQDYVAGMTTKTRENTPRVLTLNGCLSVIGIILTHDLNDASKRDEFAARVLASLLQVPTTWVFRDGAADRDIVQHGKTLLGEALLGAQARTLLFDVQLGVRLLSVTVQMVLALIQSEPESDSALGDGVLVMLTELLRTRVKAVLENDAETYAAPMTNVLESFAPLMELQYQFVWTPGLKAVVVLMELLQHVLPAHMSPTFESLVKAHGDAKVGSHAQHAVQDAVSALVQAVGLETVWDWVAWPTLSAEPGAPKVVTKDRAWLLSTVKGAALASQGDQPSLAFFQTNVLTMARMCDRMAAVKPKEQTVWRARVMELWNLFPCFCRVPSDLNDALPNMITTCCKALDDKRYPMLVVPICYGLQRLAMSVSDHGSFEGEGNDQTVVGAATIRLVPTLFKMVTDGPAADCSSMSDADRGQSIHSISGAIAHLAKLADKEFLHGLFKKLMQRLLEQVQSEDCDVEKICSYLVLGQALIESEALGADSISFLYRALKPLIRSDGNGARVQKKAYKVLAEICERNHEFVTNDDTLRELIRLLTGTISTAQVAARYMRLRCMNLILTGLEKDDAKLTEFFDVFAEIVLCLKDANGKTREAAYVVLLELARKADLATVLQAVVAALAADTPHMRSATVMALSRIVFEFGRHEDVVQRMLPSLLSTVIVLMDEHSREVVKSVVGFVRICVAAIPREQLEPLLSELVGGLLKYHKAKSRFRAKIKIILKKLVKRFGYDALMAFVPPSETRLLVHMRKTEERMARQRLQKKDSEEERDNYDKLLESDEEDSDDGRTLVSGATGFSTRTGKTATKTRASGKPLSVTSSKRGREIASSVSILNEADGEIIDMLDPCAFKKVQFAEEVDSDSDEDAMEFDTDGKLIVPDDHKTAEEPQSLESAELVAGKRRRVNDTDRSTKASSRSNGKPTHRELGAAYKSKKAGGDVKKKGQKYEPYAYVPLHGKSFSKKHRRQAVEQMSSVVRSGKRKR